MSEPGRHSWETPAATVRGWRVRLSRAIHRNFEAPALGQVLLRRQLVTRQQLAQAIAIQRLSGERLGRPSRVTKDRAALIAEYGDKTLQIA